MPDMTIKLGADTSQFQQNIQSATNEFIKFKNVTTSGNNVPVGAGFSDGFTSSENPLFRNISGIHNMDPREQQARNQLGDYLNNINDKLNRTNDSLGKLDKNINNFSNNVDANTQAGNSFVQNFTSAGNISGSGKNTVKNIASLKSYNDVGIQFARAIAGGDVAYQSAMLNADYIGAEANGWNTVSSLLGNASSLFALTGHPLFALGTAGLSAGAGIIGSYKQLDKEKSEKAYELVSSFDMMDAAYGYSNRKSWAENYLNDEKLYYNLITPKNNGLGITDTDFINYSTSLAKYGMDNLGTATDYVTQAAITSRNTGGTDINSILALMGTVSRYGGNGIESIQNLQSYANAQGLNNVQFEELLNGISRSMEEGISKGFVRSTDDISQNLLYLEKISGENPLWQGEQGATKYNQMVNSISNATSLSDTSSMLIYRAAQQTMAADIEKNGIENVLGKGGYLGNGSYADTMAYIEKGNLSKEFLQNIYTQTNTAYGGDRESVVESFRKMFGLNYENSIQLYNMLSGNAGVYNEDEINTFIQENKGMTTETYQTAVTEFMDNINEATRGIDDKVDLIVQKLGIDIEKEPETKNAIEENEIKKGIYKEFTNGDTGYNEGADYDSYLDEDKLREALTQMTEEKFIGLSISDYLVNAKSRPVFDGFGNAYTSTIEYNGEIIDIAEKLDAILKELKNPVEATFTQ